MPVNVIVEVQGLTQLKKLLDNEGDDLYLRSWNDEMEQFAEEGASQARAEAPYLTGKLLMSIAPGVSRKKFRTWSRVKVTARNRGFPYPALLAFSRRHHHRDWLIRAVSGVIDSIPKRLEKVANAVAKKWDKG